MDTNKDYYAILGVMPSAEFETIQAVYRALSKKYHPDVSQQDKTKSEEKIREINEAYEILSDVSKRREYDEGRDHTESQHSNFYEEDVDQKTSSQYSDPKIDADWDRAAEYYPDLERFRKILELLSQDLAFTYKVYVITEKKFESNENFHITLENEFLKRYFGSHKEIQKLGKKLLLDKKKFLARELNKDIVLLGSNINPNAFIQKFKNKPAYKKYYYNINVAEEEKKQKIKSERRDKERKQSEDRIRRDRELFATVTRYSTQQHIDGKDGVRVMFYMVIFIMIVTVILIIAN
jgi:curved DNA-binding protein CbpA